MPPIDPNILMQASKAYAIQPQQDPLESYAKALTLKNAMGQNTLQDLQTKTAQQGLDEDQAVRSAYQSSGGDQAAFRANLVTHGLYKQVQALDKAKLEDDAKRAGIDKDKSATKESDLKRAKEHLDITGQVFGFVKDNPTVENANRAVDQLLAAGVVDAPSAQQMKLTIPNDPNAIRAAATQNWQNSIASKDQLADFRAKEQQKETGRHNTATEKNAAGQLAESQLHNRRTEANAASTLAQGGRTYDADRGMVVNTRTGVAEPVMSGGNPLGAKEKPLTESQGKASGLSLRATRANEILNSLEDSGETNRGLIKQAAGQVPLIGGALEMGVNTLPAIAGGPNANQQKVEQARRDFVNAALRVESGASISPSEFANAERQYFPMPGDSPQVIEQKRQNRLTEIESLNLQGGKGGPSANSKPIRPATPKLGARVDGYIFKGGDPSDPKNWDK